MPTIVFDQKASAFTIIVLKRFVMLNSKSQIDMWKVTSCQSKYMGVAHITMATGMPE